MDDKKNELDEAKTLDTENNAMSDVVEAEVSLENEAKDSQEDIDAAKKAETKKGFIQFLKFLGFSIGAGVIEFVSFTLLMLISKAPNWLVAAEIISVVLSCLFNFTLNRKFTFKQSNNMLFGMLLYGAFYAVTAPLWALAMKAVVGAVGADYDLLVKAVKMILNFVLDFLYCKFIIFGLANKIDFNKVVEKVKGGCANIVAKFKKK